MPITFCDGRRFLALSLFKTVFVILIGPSAFSLIPVVVLVILSLIVGPSALEPWSLAQLRGGCRPFFFFFLALSLSKT